MQNKKATLVNIFAALITLGVQMFISFWLSPFVVGKLGEEAYGFINLANNFVSYASLVAIAINSMAFVGSFGTVVLQGTSVYHYPHRQAFSVPVRKWKSLFCMEQDFLCPFAVPCIKSPVLHLGALHLTYRLYG